MLHLELILALVLVALLGCKSPPAAQSPLLTTGSLMTIVYDQQQVISSLRRKVDSLQQMMGYTVPLRIDSTLGIETVRNPLIGRTTRTLFWYDVSPYGKLYNGRSYLIREKLAILSIGPYLGLNFRGRWSGGISIQYPLIQLKR